MSDFLKAFGIGAETEKPDEAPAAPETPARPTTFNEAFGLPTAPQERSVLGDVWKGFASSAVRTAADATAAGEYFAGSGGTLTRMREGLTQRAESISEGMSPEMKTALGREFTAAPSWMGGESDNSVWESFGTALGSTAAQIIATTGSLVSAAPAVIAGAMAGPHAVVAATAVAFATGGILGSGTVWNEVATEFQKLPEDERKKNPTYARLRADGVDEASAINEAVREAAYGHVEAAGAGSAAINAATGAFLGRLGSGKLGGVRSGAAQGFKSEAPTEFGEEGFQQDRTQRINERLTGRPYQWDQTIEAGVAGAVAGGGLGAIIGGVGGLRGRDRNPAPTPAPLDPSIVAAVGGQGGTVTGATGSAAPAAPAATPAGPPDPFAEQNTPQQRASERNAGYMGMLAKAMEQEVDPTRLSEIMGPKFPERDLVSMMSDVIAQRTATDPSAKLTPYEERITLEDARQSGMLPLLVRMSGQMNPEQLSQQFGGTYSPAQVAMLRGKLQVEPKSAGTIQGQGLLPLQVGGELVAGGPSPFAPDEDITAGRAQSDPRYGVPGQLPLRLPMPARATAPTMPFGAAPFSPPSQDLARPDMMPPDARAPAPPGGPISMSLAGTPPGGPQPFQATPGQPALVEQPAFVPPGTSAPAPVQAPLSVDAAPKPEPAPKAPKPEPAPKAPKTPAEIKAAGEKRKATLRAKAAEKVGVTKNAVVVAAPAPKAETTVVAPAAPADNPKLKVARNQATDGLRAAIQKVVDSVYGDNSGSLDANEGAVDRAVKAALDEASEGIDTAGKSIPEVVRALAVGAKNSKALTEFTARAEQWKKDQAAKPPAEDGTGKGETDSVGDPESMVEATGGDPNERLGGKERKAALTGDLIATGKVMRVLARAGSDKLKTRLRELVADIETLGKDSKWAAPAWVANVKAVYDSLGSRGKKDRDGARKKLLDSLKDAAKVSAIDELRTSKAQIESNIAAIEALAAESAKNGPAKMTTAENVERWQELSDEIAKILGTGYESTQIAKLGGRTAENRKVRAIMQVAHEGRKIDPKAGDAAAGMAQTYLVAELMIQAGQVDGAVQTVADAKAEYASSRGSDSAKGDGEVAGKDGRDVEDDGPEFDFIDDNADQDAALEASIEMQREALENQSAAIADNADEGITIDALDSSRLIGTGTQQAVAGAIVDAYAGVAPVADGAGVALTAEQAAKRAPVAVETKKVRGSPEQQAKRNADIAAKAAERAAGMIQKLQADDIKPSPRTSRRGFLKGAAATVMTWTAWGKAWATNAPMMDMAKRGNLAGALSSIVQYSEDANHRALAEKLIPLIDGIRLRVIEVGKSYDETFPGALRSALGLASVNVKTGEGTIYLRHDPSGARQDGLTEETLLHEAIHAALLRRYGNMDNRVTDSKEGWKLKGPVQPGDEHIRVLISMWQEYRDSNIWPSRPRNERVTKDVRDNMFLSEPFNDFDEFISYAVTSPKFQAWLKGQKLNTEGRWKRFVRAIGGFLGFGATYPTFLEAALDATNSLLTAAVNVKPGSLETASLASDPEVQKASKTFDATADVLNRAREAIYPKNAGESIFATAGDKLKRIGLAFSTMRQMEAWAAKLFTRSARQDWFDYGGTDNAHTAASKAYLERNVIAQTRLREFLPAVDGFNALSREHNDQLSTFMVDASLAEAHPDKEITDPENKHLVGAKVKQGQARARHAELRKQWKALTPQQQAVYLEATRVLRQAHADIVRGVSDGIIDRWWRVQAEEVLKADPNARTILGQTPDKVAGFLNDIKSRALTNKLDINTDGKLLGDDVWELLRTARERTKMDGPYVPLQRFGDYVVSWTENAPDTVYFDTQAEADQFSASTPYHVLGAAERYFDKNGKLIEAADPAILQNEMGKALTAAGPRATADEIAEAKRNAKAEAWKLTKKAAASTKIEVRQQVQGTQFFESLGEARTAARELTEAGKNVRETGRRMTPEDRRSLLIDADFNKLKASIENDKALTREQRDKALDSLTTAMLTITPQRGLNATLVKRRKVIGASNNIQRVMSNYGIAASNFYAGISTDLKLTSALAEMAQQEQDGRTRAGGKDSNDTLNRGNLRFEMEQRILNSPMSSPTGNDVLPWIRRLQALSYIHYLASPAYSMIQMTQPWMLTAPILAARYGAYAGPRALAKAMNDVGAGGILKAGAKDSMTGMRTFIMGAEGKPQAILDGVKAAVLRNEKDPKRAAEINAMLDSLEKEGLVDGDAGLELIRANVTAEGFAWRKLGQLEAMTRALPASIEVLNRTSSAVATYRLARNAGKTHAQAIAEAREVVDQSQGDYGSANTARYMDARRYPWIAPMMTFRKYAQAVYGLLARQTYQAFKGASPAERKEARRILAYVLGAHVAVAGTLGLPTEAITIVLGAAALAMGEDEPWDWELDVRQALAEVFGTEAAEVITRGLPRAAGIDLHSRMGLNSLIFINDLKNFEKASTMEYMGNLLTGAPGAMVANWIQGLGSLADGDVAKATQAAFPMKAIRDGVKAYRFEDEGITTKRGERIDANRDASVDEIVMQALGFTPAAVAETYERRNAVQGANRKLGTERIDLIRRWRQAEPSDRAEAWSRILDWNRELPTEAGREVRITRANLIASEREMKRRNRESGGADYLPKGREFLRREGEFANTRN